MLLISEEEVIKLLDFKEAIEAIERALLFQSRNEAQNIPRSRIFIRDKVFHVMASSIEALDIVGLKSYLSTPSRTVFVVLLFSLSRNELLAVIEADILGRIRTGVASAIATKYLAREDSSIVGIVGSGKQAYTQALAISSLRNYDKILVVSQDPSNAERIVERLRSRGLKAFRAESIESLAKSSDIISTATNSRTPFLRSEWVRDGVHVNLVGSNHPSRVEAYPELFLRAKLVVTDSIEQAKRESGDLLSAIEKGYIKWENIHELWEVVSRRVSRSDYRDVTIFKSHGIALWDVAVAKLVYDKARERGLGREIDFKGFWDSRFF
ncbi:MAG: ornithine cyclodeaminase family protein [Sulfolobales archaeon]